MEKGGKFFPTLAIVIDRFSQLFCNMFSFVFVSLFYCFFFFLNCCNDERDASSGGRGGVRWWTPSLLFTVHALVISISFRWTFSFRSVVWIFPFVLLLLLLTHVTYISIFPFFLYVSSLHMYYVSWDLSVSPDGYFQKMYDPLPYI